MIRRSSSRRILYLLLSLLLVGGFILCFLWIRIFWFSKTGPYNIYLSADKIYLISLKPSLPEIIIGGIDNSTKLNVPLGYGVYQAQALGNLDYQETGPKAGKQGEIIQKTILNNYYFFPSFYILYLNRNDRPVFNKIINNRANLFDLIVFYKEIKSGQVKTNLSSYDIFHIYYLTKSVSRNKIKVFDFPEKDKFSQEFNLLVSDLAINWRVRQENMEISLANGTGKKGLAGLAEKIIESFGADVTSISTSDKISKTTVCRISKSSFSRSETYLLLKEIFHCQSLVRKNEDGGDIKLIIGNDFAF